LRDGTVITHNTRPHFATRALGKEFDGKVQHRKFVRNKD
jgi:hypothetical protein